MDLTTLFSYAENQYGFGSVNEDGGSSFILEKGKLRMNIYLIDIPRNELNLSYEVIYHVALFESLYDGKVEIIMQPPPPLNDWKVHGTFSCQAGVYNNETKRRICCYKAINFKLMNVKRTFGTVLTILGIIGLIWAGVGFVQKTMGTRELIIVGIIGLIFFFAGIGLVRNTKDEA